LGLLDQHYIKSFAASIAHGSFYGLYELLCSMASRLPDDAHSEVLAACRMAVVDLVEHELVRLHMTPAHAERPTRDGCPLVPLEEVSGVLGRDESWESPRESRATYWLSTTEAGEAAYFSPEILSL
jgi:hypothetical protein